MLPYVLDGFLLAFMLWFALVGLRHGLIGMLGRLLSSLAALAAAWLLIGPVESFARTLPLYAGLREGLAASILKLIGRTARSLPEAAAALGLPPLLQRSLIGASAGTAAGAMPGPLPEAPAGGAATALAAAASALADRILGAIVFMLLFTLILMAVRLVIGLSSHVANHLPVIGPLNRLTGLLAGLAYALLIVFGLLFLSALAAPWLPGVPKAIGDTTLLASLYRGNPLLFVL